MQRNVSATVIGLVGTPEGLPDRLAAPNVRVVDADADQPPLERATIAWREAVRTHRPYVVHDADPLAAVADAWVELYDGSGVAGDIELSISAAREAWRLRRIELPDYYLVADPERLGPTRRHWYLGVLHAAAPSRVVPVDPDPTAILDALGHLPSGRWWPDLDVLLDGIDRVLPERLTSSDAGPSRPSGQLIP